MDSNLQEKLMNAKLRDLKIFAVINGIDAKGKSKNELLFEIIQKVNLTPDKDDISILDKKESITGYPKFKNGIPSNSSYRSKLEKSLKEGKTCRPTEDNCEDGSFCEVSNIGNPAVKSYEDFGVCVKGEGNTDYIKNTNPYVNPKKNIRIFGNKSNVEKFKKYISSLEKDISSAEEKVFSISDDMEDEAIDFGDDMEDEAIDFGDDMEDEAIDLGDDVVSSEEELREKFEDMKVSQLKNWLKDNFSRKGGALPKRKAELVEYAVAVSLRKNCGKDGPRCAKDFVCDISEDIDEGVCVPSGSKDGEYCIVFQGNKYYGSKKALKTLERSFARQGIDPQDCDDFEEVSINDISPSGTPFAEISPPPSPKGKNPFDESMINVDGSIKKGKNPFDTSVEKGKNPFDTSVEKGKNPFDTSIEKGKNPFDTSIEKGKNPFDTSIEKGKNPFDASMVTVEGLISSGQNPFKDFGKTKPLIAPEIFDLDFNDQKVICANPIVALMETSSKTLTKLLYLNGAVDIPKKKMHKITLLCGLVKGKVCDPENKKFCDTGEACAIQEDNKGICINSLETWSTKKGYSKVKNRGRTYFGKKNKMKELREYFRGLDDDIDNIPSEIDIEIDDISVFDDNGAEETKLGWGDMELEISGKPPQISADISAVGIDLDEDLSKPPQISLDTLKGKPKISPSDPIVINNYKDIQLMLAGINSSGSEMDKFTKEKISRCLGLIA